VCSSDLASIAFADVADAKAVRKLAPHSSRRCAKFVIGRAIKAILSTTPRATINSAKMTPITINGNVFAINHSDNSAALVNTSIGIIYFLHLSYFICSCLTFEMSDLRDTHTSYLVFF